MVEINIYKRTEIRQEIEGDKIMRKIFKKRMVMVITAMFIVTAFAYLTCRSLRAKEYEPTETTCSNGREHNFEEQFEVVYHDGEYKDVKYRICNGCGKSFLYDDENAWREHKGTTVINVDFGDGTCVPWEVDCTSFSVVTKTETIKDVSVERVITGYMCTRCGWEK